MTRKSEMGVVEVVLVRARPGVTDEQILEASDALQQELARFQGYISRRVLKSEDGQWLDIVDWTSLDDALRAAEAIMQRPIADEYLSLVETESLRMLHLTPRRVYAAGPTAA